MSLQAEILKLGDEVEKLEADRDELHTIRATLLVDFGKSANPATKQKKAMITDEADSVSTYAMVIDVFEQILGLEKNEPARELKPAALPRMSELPRLDI